MTRSILQKLKNIAQTFKGKEKYYLMLQDEQLLCNCRIYIHHAYRLILSLETALSFAQSLKRETILLNYQFKYTIKCYL